MTTIRWQWTSWGVLALLTGTSLVYAQETVRLREQFPADYVYHVSSRVELSGSLTLPLEKGETTSKTLAVSGNSALEYDERVLDPGSGQVQKTARLYKRLEFQRKVGEQQQQNALRPAVRRLILLRHNQVEVPFSPDGPLLWGEIDLVRTDVFTPALQGLLADGPVRQGDRWTATAAAVQELTDLERIVSGSITCKLEQFTMFSNRRHARVGFGGTVEGVGEDGRSRHQLDGYLFFDLESNHLSYLSVLGVQSLLDKDGKTVGKVEGNFVLTRRPLQRSDELSNEALRGASLVPNEDNTQLLYDNPDLGIRFLYPRRWRVAGVRGRQLAVDENRGSGLLLTVEPPASVPTGEQFLQESRAWLQQQKATVLKAEPVRLVQQATQKTETFALEVEAGRQRFRMEYYVIRHTAGGVVIAARLLPTDMATLQRDVQRMVNSLQISRPP